MIGDVVNVSSTDEKNTRFRVRSPSDVTKITGTLLKRVVKRVAIRLTVSIITALLTHNI